MYKQVLGILTCCLLVSGCQAQGENGGHTASETDSGNTDKESQMTAEDVFDGRTAEEKRIAAKLEEEREDVIQLLSEQFGELFPDEELAVTAGMHEGEEKVIIHHKKDSEQTAQLKRLVGESGVSQVTAFKEIKYAPREVRSYALEIADFLQQDQTAADRVAGIDPEAVDEVIYVLITEELDQQTEEQVATIFPNVQFVKVSESTGFTED